ncbi:inorganic polyphosphate kinase [Clostridiaceae bacterium 14S0207]|nr:inorganic polyphosphate kinase [Clostridiaceae bacterium 14S0207]
MKQDYEKIGWQDHIVEKPYNFAEKKNSDGTITLIPKEGEVLQQGTPVNSRTLGHMEDGIAYAVENTNMNADSITKLSVDVAILKGSTINNMTNNVFFERFENLEDINLEQGIFDNINKRVVI